jgi:hypothetical protein
MRGGSLLALAVLFVVGCGSRTNKFAPVSGKVTMNNQPLANAIVTFSPIAPEGSTQAGDSSAGKTNDKGEFTLESTKGVNGALVGKHNVSISLLKPDTGDGDNRPTRKGWTKEQIPEKYSGKSTLTFDVPSDGTDQANFALTKP